MGDLALGEEYANFRAWVPKNILPVGGASVKNWLFYDWGPRDYPQPLICIHGVPGGADIFFHQMIQLAPRGYRLLLIQIPAYSSVAEFCDALQLFLDMLLIHKVHFYGVGLGGFLALNFASRNPDRVVSIALTHSFCSTLKVIDSLRIPPPALWWFPTFVLHKIILGMLPRGQVELHLAMAVEFLIARTLETDRDSLISRLTMALTPSTVSSGRLRMKSDSITLIDSVHSLENKNSLSAQLSAQLLDQFPLAKHALMKEGGDFPYLTNPDEVSMHLVVHLRRVAPDPTKTLSLPPPARARVLCPEEYRLMKEAIRRSRYENAEQSGSQNSGSGNNTFNALNNYEHDAHDPRIQMKNSSSGEFPATKSPMDSVHPNVGNVAASEIGGNAQNISAYQDVPNVRSSPPSRGGGINEEYLSSSPSSKTTSNPRMVNSRPAIPSVVPLDSEIHNQKVATVVSDERAEVSRLSAINDGVVEYGADPLSVQFHSMHPDDDDHRSDSHHRRLEPSNNSTHYDHWDVDYSRDPVYNNSNSHMNTQQNNRNSSIGALASSTMTAPRVLSSFWGESRDQSDDTNFHESLISTGTGHGLGVLSRSSIGYGTRKVDESNHEGNSRSYMNGSPTLTNVTQIDEHTSNVVGSSSDWNTTNHESNNNSTKNTNLNNNW
eukprot:CAMPEP_0182447026 /NCGR_PEP_ID=MMETSP1172-20130603/10410_1 /TAXON_ID=708627 /ORGANISM="Timspurckia oligopyrenoides, Strain CCMP3278" /LENGTH=661 /DNA_ID=CAMNT_0024643277 /DNA_START=18 /DNA_END=2000 /DNA_ORIENTATION=-